MRQCFIYKLKGGCLVKRIFFSIFLTLICCSVFAAPDQDLDIDSFPPPPMEGMCCVCQYVSDKSHAWSVCAGDSHLCLIHICSFVLLWNTSQCFECINVDSFQQKLFFENSCLVQPMQPCCFDSPVRCTHKTLICHEDLSCLSLAKRMLQERRLLPEEAATDKIVQTVLMAHKFHSTYIAVLFFIINQLLNLHLGESAAVLSAVVEQTPNQN